jgi:hypothetical protein
MLASTDRSDQLAFYSAAMAGLRFIEARSPTQRRFGPDADALWKELKGHLSTADRIDLLLRDADAQWPGSFGARTVFGLRAVAEDEPFGADWRPLDDVDAEELWRAATRAAPPAHVEGALHACAKAWSISLAPVQTGTIGAATKLLIAGPSAIAATALAFASGTDLAWAEQVICVASAPNARQLAALAGALLNTTRPTRTVDPETDLAALRSERIDRLVESPDASGADLEWARRALEGAR